MNRPTNRTAEVIRRVVRSSLATRCSSRGEFATRRPSSMRSARASRRCGNRAAVPATGQRLLPERLHEVAALVAQELRGVGLDGVPHIEVGVERAAEARGQRHRTDDEQEVLGQLERQRPHRFAELDREAAQLALVDLPHLGESHAPEAREQLGHSSLELCRIGRRQQDADTTDAVDQPLPVTRGDGEDDLLQAASQSVGHLAHHAEVDEGEHPGRGGRPATPHPSPSKPATQHPSPCRPA